MTKTKTEELEAGWTLRQVEGKTVRVLDRFMLILSVNPAERKARVFGEAEFIGFTTPVAASEARLPLPAASEHVSHVMLNQALGVYRVVETGDLVWAMEAQAMAITHARALFETWEVETCDPHEARSKMDAELSFMLRPVAGGIS